MPLKDTDMKNSLVENIDIYVSTNGSDKNGDGTILSPVKTIKRAQELAKSHTAGNIAVHIARGEYFISEPLVFTPDDGGDKKSVLYIGDGAVISGGKAITGWELFDKEKNIYKAKNIDFDFAQLYVNGERAVRAKSVAVNKPYSTRMIKAFREEETQNGCAYPRECVTVDASLVSYWKDLSKIKKDLKLKVLMAWTDNTLPIESIEIIGNKAVIKIQEPASSRVFNRPHPDITGYSHEFTVDFVCWLENAYELIDEDNEWYFDKSEGVLYYKAPKNTDINKTEFIAPFTQTLIEIKGSSEKRVKNLTFKGITFCYTNWTKPNDEGLVCAQASQYVLTSSLDNKITVYRPPSAVSVIYGEGINFEGNTFKNIGATALDYHYGNIGGAVEGNSFYSIAGNGINIGKFALNEKEEIHNAYNPKDKSEICCNQVIKNNYLTKTGQDYEGSVGIGAGYPKGITITHNTLSYMPYTGISVGFGWSNCDNAMQNNKITHNHIHNVNMAVCDGAAIYTLSKQPDSEVAYNYIHDFNRKSWFDYGCAGMYFDEQTQGYYIHDNVMINCPNIWQNQNPKDGNRLENNGDINDESVILSCGVEEKYRHILPESELPKIQKK